MKESSKKVSEIFSKNESPRAQIVDETAAFVPAVLATIVFSGTSTFIMEEQREDVFSREVIIEKTGFRTKTEKKYNLYYPSQSLSRYAEARINTGYYGVVSLTGVTDCVF